MVARKKPSDRLPLGSRRSSGNTACGGGTSETGARCALGRCHTTSQGTPAGDQCDTDCIRRSHRTGGPRPRCQPRASRRQSHRLMEATFGEKWLEVLKEIDPRVTRAAIVFNPQTAPITADLLHNVEVAAQRFAIQPIATPVRQISEIETAAAMLAREPGGGMILLPDSFTTTNRKPIIEAVAHHRLPAVFPFKFFAAEGGLLSYGVDNSELYQRAAIYVDRILKGEKPADLPVQQPTKFELVINLKTAKALGLEVPPTLLARADEVIE